MDSEVHEFTASLVGAPIAEKQPPSEVCEDMAIDSVSTNGISNLSASGVVINYIDEEQEQLSEMQEPASIGSDIETQPNESQDGVETGEENDILEKNDLLEEEYEEEEEGIEEQEQEDEEEVDDEFAEEGLEGELLPQKECAQVPKKRKFAPTEAANADNEIETTEAATTADAQEDDEALEEDEDGEFIEEDNAGEEVLPDAGNVSQQDDEEDGEELPTSSARAAANKENTVDEDTCRVCTTKDNLITLFKYIEQQTVAEMLMTICPNVSIACKDFMPQYICQRCLDNVTIAVQLKSQCESTERELRKKLSRHKNKVRRPSGYVVIDAPVESDPEEEEEELADDVEFKVSDVEVSASADESYTEDDSDFDEKKKRGKRGGRKSVSKSKKVAGRSLKRTSNSSDEERVENPNKKKKENSYASSRAYEFPCDECNQVFSRKLSLVLHKKTHSQGPPIICKLCGKNFKMQGSYRSHMERHKNEKNHYSCGKCDYFFSTKGEMRKHQMEEHEEKPKPITFKCKKCQRIFSSQMRLQRHCEGVCPGNDYGQKTKRAEFENYSSGRDLFKAVAPLTTTYWSDSFSD